MVRHVLPRWTARCGLVAALVAALSGCAGGRPATATSVPASAGSAGTGGSASPTAAPSTSSPSPSSASSPRSATTRPPSPPPTSRPTAAGPPRPTSTTRACSIPASLRGLDVTHVSRERVIALTFDAGSSDAGVDRILATLARTDTPATFFLTGRFARTYPGAARRIAARHPVGNHTMTHAHLTRLGDAAIRAELADAGRAITSGTGKDPHPLFRFPFGDVSPHAIAVVNGSCYVPFRWTVDSLGWKGTSGGLTVTAVRDRVVSGAGPGGIVLMHVGANPDDGTTLDADALSGIITRLRADGYRFVTLRAAL